MLCSRCREDLVGAEVIEEAEDTSTIVSSSENTLSVPVALNEGDSVSAESELACEETC